MDLLQATRRQGQPGGFSALRKTVAQKGFVDSFDKVDWKQLCNTCICTTATLLLQKEESMLDVLTLEGEKCCSTTVFTKLGVLEKNMVCVSSQPGVVDKIKKRYPLVTASSKNLSDFVDGSRIAYDLIYVDLCCTWETGRNTIIRATLAAKKSCVFGFAVCRRNSFVSKEDIVDEFSKAYKELWAEEYPSASCDLVKIIALRKTPSYYVFIYHLTE